MAGVTVPIDGDITPLLSEFAKLPGRTQQEMEAVGRVMEAEITRGRVAKAFGELPGVTQKQARKAANMLAREIDKGAKEAQASIKDVDKVFKVLGSSALDDLDDLATGFTALGVAGGLAGTAIAGAAGAAAILVAEGALVSFLWDAAKATGRLEDEQVALDGALKDVQVRLGDKVVPVFEEFYIVAGAGAMALGDLVDTTWEYIKTAVKLFEAGGAVAAGIDAASGGMMKALSVMVKLNDATDSGVRAHGFYIDRMRAEVAQGKNIEHARKVAAAAQQEQTRSTKHQTAAVEKQTAAVEELSDAEIDAAIQFVPWEEQKTQIIAENTAAREKNLQRQRDEMAAAAAAAQAQREAWGAAGMATLGAFEAIGDAVGALAEDGSAAAGAAVAIQKAAALVSVTISTAQAVMQALATIPPPAGYVAAGAMIATGVAQAALIAAQPESFHTGGVRGWSPDETMARVRPGEGVLTSQGVQAMGGASGVAAANRGEGSRPLRVEMRYEHKMLSDVLGDNLRMRSSPLRTALREGRARAGIRRRDG